MWFVYLVMLAIALVIDCLIAEKFYSIAGMKGHNERCYFWWSVIFPLAGWMMVIALPNLNDKNEKSATDRRIQQFNVPQFSDPQEAKSESFHAWRCECGKMITSMPCPHCGKE